ncbi:MAG: cysteine--tRNA ligase [Candidatus Aenigmarchaeota archaeon]|nr:cysteine--tRNA ligase [Candidatus Aenigmarchaeota archaeon]
MLRLYNAMTQKKEPVPERAGIYVCGITPYNVAHLGHASLYVFYDVLIRYLHSIGRRTLYVQNVTDIDDDVLKKAKETGKDWRQLGNENTRYFLTQMDAVGNERPDIYCRATDHVPEMIRIIADLIGKSMAYEINGHVYFSVSGFRGFGKLSKLKKNEMLAVANERGNNPDDKNKKNPMDFVLWQRSAEGEPSWDSPWSKGRPGWHIECTAMARKYLKNVAIHGGGGDLAFPHHECEIAQCPAVYHGTIWAHQAMVFYQGRKMSKSLGNLVMVEDLLKKYSVNAVRMAILLHHYREEWEFSEAEMRKAAELGKKLNSIWDMQSGTAPFDSSSYEKDFFALLDDDMQTGAALQALRKLSEAVSSGKNISSAKAFMTRAFNILGIRPEWQGDF